MFRLTATLMFLAASAYYWHSEDGQIWTGIFQPWQYILNLAGVYAISYWALEFLASRAQEWAIKLISLNFKRFHPIITYFGIIVFTGLYTAYLPTDSTSNSVWPLFIYPMMLTSKQSKAGVTPWPIINTGIFYSIAGLIEAQRLEPSIILKSLLWLISIGTLIHYFLRLHIDIGDRLAILNTVSDQLMRLPHSDRYYQEVVDLIGNNFKFPVVHLITVSENPEIMKIRAGYGKSREVWGRVEIPIGQSVVGYAAKHRLIQTWDNVGKCEYYFASDGYEDIKSEICAPIYTDQELIGVLDSESEQKSFFSQGDVAMLTILARVIGIAIMQENASNRVRRAVDQSWENLSDLDDTKSIFGWLAQYIAEELNADLISCYPLMIGTGYPKPIPFVWPAHDDPSQKKGFINRARIMKGLTGPENAVTNMVVKWTPYFQTEADNDPIFLSNFLPGRNVDDSFIKRELIKSTAFLPIGVEENRLGAIFINFRCRHRFTDVEIGILKALAQAAAPHLMRVQKVWQIYQGFDRPELNIHQLISSHKMNVNDIIQDLRSTSSENSDISEITNALEQEMAVASREFLLAVSGQRLSFRNTPLVEGLITCGLSLSKSSNLRIQYFATVAPRVEKLAPEECKIVLYRIASEVMNNVARHSDATTCAVNIYQNRLQLILEVTQNGTGFVPNQGERGKNGIFDLLELAQEYMGADYIWLPQDTELKTGLKVIFPVLPRSEELAV